MLKVDVSNKIHALKTDVSKNINENVKGMQKTLSSFLFRGAILVCLLIFIFLTIADILLPDFGGGIFLQLPFSSLLPFKSMCRNWRGKRLSFPRERKLWLKKLDSNAGCELGISMWCAGSVLVWLDPERNGQDILSRCSVHESLRMSARHGRCMERWSPIKMKRQDGS